MTPIIGTAIRVTLTLSQCSLLLGLSCPWAMAVRVTYEPKHESHYSCARLKPDITVGEKPMEIYWFLFELNGETYMKKAALFFHTTAFNQDLLQLSLFMDELLSKPHSFRKLFSGVNE